MLPCLRVICQADLGTQQSWALPGCGEGVLCSGIQHVAAWLAEELVLVVSRGKCPPCSQPGARVPSVRTPPRARHSTRVTGRCGREGRGFEGRESEISLVHSCTAHSLCLSCLFEPLCSCTAAQEGMQSPGASHTQGWGWQRRLSMFCLPLPPASHVAVGVLPLPHCLPVPQRFPIYRAAWAP